MKRPFETTGLTILDRYILKEFLLNLLLILASLVVLFLVVDFFQRIRMFISNSATVGQVAVYFFYSIPTILVQMIPVSVLLSSLITFGTFSRYCELVALRASGVSLYRAALPPLLSALVIALATFLISEFITPYANQRVKHTKYVEIQNRTQSGTFKHHEIWYRGKRGIYNIAVFDPHTNVLRGIRINYLDESMNLVKRIDAAEGFWRNGTWVFHRVMIATFPEGDFPHIETRKSMKIDIPEKPQDFLIVQREPDEMGFGELRRYITKIRSEGYDAGRYLADLHGKAAFPFVSVIMAVLGLCFAARSERSGGIAQGIGIGIATGLSYWLVFAFTMSLGRSGALPPVIGAWAANILFLAASIFLLRRIRT